MSVATARHDWLRRVSDYQSGGVSDYERAAVEAHLATCQGCQEALAMYRRFYGLLRSPLRLGPPSLHLDEETTMIGNYPAPPSSPGYQPERPPRPSRRGRVLAGIAAILAATLVVVGFLAVYGMRNLRPAATATATPQATVAPTPAPTTTANVTPTPGPDAFVCANPPGSNMTYVYQRGDRNLYIVTGCTLPARIPVSAYSFPRGWSPDNRYLAIESVPTNSSPTSTYPLVLYERKSGQIITTHFFAEYPPDETYGQTVRFFLGWVGDNTFLGAVQPVVANNPDGPLGPSTIVKVDVATQRETQVGTITWFAATRIIAPGYLFYAGYQSKSEGQAYLHRLDLNTGADLQLVPLGAYGNGGCQGTIFCNWTAPWDVSPDGTHIIYHNPGPTGFPSDTSIVKDTPLVFSALDGSNPSTPFGTTPSNALSTPTFSPQGRYLITTGVTDREPPLNESWLRLWPIGYPVIDVQGAFLAWRGDNQAMVLLQTGANNAQSIVSYDLSSHTTTALEQNSFWYLWAH